MALWIKDLALSLRGPGPGLWRGNVHMPEVWQKKKKKKKKERGRDNALWTSQFHF